MTNGNLSDHIRTDVLVFSGDETIEDVLGRMLTMRVSSSLIVENNREIKGILTERDIMRKLARIDPSKLERPVRAVMSFPVAFAHLDTLVTDIAHLHLNKQKRHFPILRDPKIGPLRDNLVGILTVTDLCKIYLKELVLG